MMDNLWNGNFEGKGITVIALTFNEVGNEKRNIVSYTSVVVIAKSELKDT